MNFSTLIIKYKLLVLCLSLMLISSVITYFAMHTQYMAQQQSREAMQDQMYDQVYSDLHKTPSKHTPAPFPGTFKQ